MLYGKYDVTMSNPDWTAYLQEYRRKALMPSIGKPIQRLRLIDISVYGKEQPDGVSLITRNGVLIGVGYKTKDYQRATITREEDGSLKLFIDGNPTAVEGLGFMYDATNKQVKHRRLNKVLVQNFK